VTFLEDPHIRESFASVCEHQEDTISAQINEEDMGRGRKHSKAQLSNPEYLKAFCAPYVYTRIFLEVCLFISWLCLFYFSHSQHDALQSASSGSDADAKHSHDRDTETPKHDKDCADNATTRGKYCNWYHMCVWPPEDDIFVR
jgi:hypothetical protein